ncbi:ARHGAP5 [Lepeophtheirus salmonis]|uniref:ARHGAP5 n=1 Tax=Lepeophtheirus salmonis TaxID=72036 RepID=A0A7R8H391_LEPSM|nr:ARHGAP5 [Lepeophtheirus salmonis]CAF2838787.1 ARHGAP5 [Lepeophtheirus salmonis]
MDHHHPKSKLESAWSATLGAGSRGMMRAAGGLTLRRGDSAASSGPSKLTSISVIGLSGSEKEKGSVGTGKSCLINRFIQPTADNYGVDHISCFSQSDFCGRVVNNDHFFILGGSGKFESYVKRCTNTKLVSAEKIAYICKDQLGIEREYEQKFMPDGRFTVDVDVCASILTTVLRMKKPIILVATKCDEAHEIYVREIEKLVNRKEFKGLVPVVECSAHENINVDQAFFALAQMIDRTRGRSRIISYYEAAAMKRETLDHATDAFQRLLKLQITDYGSMWSTTSKKLSNHHEYMHYVDIFGKDTAQRLFKRHIRKLKDDYLGAKVQRYLDLLPEVLHELFPDFDTMGEGCDHFICHMEGLSWTGDFVKERIREHPDFDHWFIEYPEDTTWMEADLFDGGESTENRIPYDILEMPEAENVYKNHLNQLHANQKRLEFRKDFKILLEEMGCVTPGKSINELRVLFLGRECFENLSERDVQDIYDLHQREIIVKAKKNFQELLLERSDLFYQFRSSPTGTITQDDIFDITELLQEDSRYKALDRMDADRKLLLYQHLGFVHCPIREHCPAFPNCFDSCVERIVSKKATRPNSFTRGGNRGSGPNNILENSHLNLLVLGIEGLANDLANHIRNQCNDNDFEYQGHIFSLEFRTVTGDVSLPENAFRTQDFLPHGCFCTFSNADSFEYIRVSLEKTLLSNLEHEDRLPFQGLPLVLVFAPDSSLTEKDLAYLRKEGQSIADSFQCSFINVCVRSDLDNSFTISDNLIEDAIRDLIDGISRRSGILNAYQSATSNNTEPDIRIIMCMLCGDPYNIEHVLAPVLTHQNSSCINGERGVTIEMPLGDKIRRRIEIIISSYHGATEFRDELIHGFILVYSTNRKASLATLSAFSMDVPELPILVYGINDITIVSGGLSTLTGIQNNTSSSANEQLRPLLISEGKNLSERLNAHFINSNTSQQKVTFYTEFFQEVFDKKSEIESAFSMEDNNRLDDSGEGTLERPSRRIQPVPPPRMDSYRLKRGPPSNASRSGSGSEIYERLPGLDSGSLVDDEPSFDDRLRLSPSDEDSDIYSHVDSMDRQNGGPTEHLIKPSLIKNRRKQQDVSSDSSFISFPARPMSRRHLPPAGGGITTAPPPPPPPPPPPLPSQRLFKADSLNTDRTGYFENRGFEGFPSPDTPPEPAPPDPRDPRNNSSNRGGTGGFTTTTNAPPKRLVKASTMPAATGPNASMEDITCWVDDSLFLRRKNDGLEDSEMWNSNGSSTNNIGGGAFTTGRRRPPPPVKPRGQLPGRLNMNDFNKITAALTSMQLENKLSPRSSINAPLAISEDIDQGGYAVPRDNLKGGGGSIESNENVKSKSSSSVSSSQQPNEYAQPISLDSSDLSSSGTKNKLRHRERREQIAMQADGSGSDSESSSDDEASSRHGNNNRPPHKRQHRKKKGVAIPVATPKVPPMPTQMPRVMAKDPTKSPTIEPDRAKLLVDPLASPRGDEFPSSSKFDEKQRKKWDKENRQRLKDDERRKLKDEKRRLKEEKEKRDSEAKQRKKEGKSKLKANSVQAQPTLDDFKAAPDKPVPVFLNKCITYIEKEGLDAEGLYRVPGNRAHVELLFQKFDEDQNVDINTLDIAVNAVATAVKDFFCKRLPPILGTEQMNDLDRISSIQDRSIRTLELSKLLKRLPKTNFCVLKFIFQHFVRVTELSKDNCMDSKNLAICWWPTLLQYEFEDLGKFEAVRPHMEEVVQTLIDQFRFLFCGQEEVMMV